MPDTIKWGILGTGGIAHSLAQGIGFVDDAVLVAVGSRSQSSADKFGGAYGIPNRHSSYEALAADPDVDVIYVATPHGFHYEHAMLCIEAGKHVLCEKAFAMNAKEVQAMIDAARNHNVFLMEAMWMWFNPGVNKAKELIAAGEIGTPNFLTADFGFNTPYNPTSRLFDPVLGGGALLDIGIYPLALALFLFGKPDNMTSFATLAPTGVDAQCAISFQYDDGKLANLSASFQADMPCEAVISGTEGHLTLKRRFWETEQLSLSFHTKQDYVLDIPVQGNGYNYEVEEVQRCIRAGKLESDVMPLQTSLEMMQLMDELRLSWGVRYPKDDV